MLKVKNPWNRRPWIGPFSSADQARWTIGLKKALGVTEKDFIDMSENGIFWIGKKHFYQLFISIYLSIYQSI
jgi:hypothetical protein